MSDVCNCDMSVVIYVVLQSNTRVFQGSNPKELAIKWILATSEQLKSLNNYPLNAIIWLTIIKFDENELIT